MKFASVRAINRSYPLLVQSISVPFEYPYSVFHFPCSYNCMSTENGTRNMDIRTELKLTVLSFLSPFEHTWAIPVGVIHGRGFIYGSSKDTMVLYTMQRAQMASSRHYRVKAGVFSHLRNFCLCHYTTSSYFFTL